MIGNTLGNIIVETGKEVTEVEKHLHNREKWFGLAGTPVGETHAADRMAGGVDPFQLVAGNDTFGAWVQILGSDDTPVEVGKTRFDGHRVMVTSTTSTNAFITQIMGGESADFAVNLAAEAFTEFPYISGSNNNDSGITDILTIRPTDGFKIWARTCCIGASGSTIDLYFGIHEYDL